MTNIFVIPGHGAGDPGAGGYGYNEADSVRALATRIKHFGGDAVELADFSRNYFEDNGISTLDLPVGSQIVELHMDSGGAGAHGGHVIIQAGAGGADGFDEALASLMESIFPGRSNLIVERDDLANPWRATQRGFCYRLVENGFISDEGDLNTFNERIDDIAIGYCKAFGIVVEEEGDKVQLVSNDGGSVFRLYNPHSGFHHYTTSVGEKDALMGAGWRFEGEAWKAKASQRHAVYRMYNASNGDHLLTINYGEAANLQKAGWKYEGVPFFASDDGAEVYRVYNPNSGEHFYTTDAGEAESLQAAGWMLEGVAFRA